jgi:hypothetical protein
MIEDALAVEPGFELREKSVPTPGGLVKICYLVCEPMERAGFANAFSTRIGGVSPLPSRDLNLSTFKGDPAENVLENRRRFLQALGMPGIPIVTGRQTHSSNRVSIETLEQAAGPSPECDALTTRLPGILLAVQTADCLPILIADPSSGTLAAIHAGWRGTAGRITERTIADLILKSGVNTRNCIAALGPSACVECYEVGPDVIERYKKEFGYWRNLLTEITPDGKAHLDVAAANIQQLLFCGFTEDRIYVAPYCTMHQNDLFFSYRRERTLFPGGTGRLLSVIGRSPAYI